MLFHHLKSRSKRIVKLCVKMNIIFYKCKQVLKYDRNLETNCFI